MTSLDRDYFYNKQLQSLRDYMKEQEEKKMIEDAKKKIIENAKFESEAIPCVVIEMKAMSLEVGDQLSMPEFTLEMCPKTLEGARTLFEYMQKGTKLNMSMEHRGLFLEKNLHAPTLAPERIIHSGPATIVFWNDKTKTVVKCSENDIYDEYEAFCAALAIKMFGSNSHLKKMIRDKTEDRTPKKEEVDDLVAEIKVKCEDNSLQEALNRLKRTFGVEEKGG